jgi:hypothetical protein
LGNGKSRTACATRQESNQSVDPLVARGTKPLEWHSIIGDLVDLSEVKVEQDRPPRQA